MKTREQLETRERDLAGQQRKQAEFLGICESLPMADPGARDDLLRQERGKLLEIEAGLSRVRETLRRLPAAPTTAPPTPS